MEVEELLEIGSISGHRGRPTKTSASLVPENPLAAIIFGGDRELATALIGHDLGLGAPSILGAEQRAMIWGLAYWILWVCGSGGLDTLRFAVLWPREPSTYSTPNPKSLIP